MPKLLLRRQEGFLPVPIIFIIAALFFGGVAVSTGVIKVGSNKPKPAPSGYSQTDYKNEAEGISVNLPGNEWTRKDGSGDTLTQFLAPKEDVADKFIENVTLAVTDFSSKPAVTLREIMDAWISQNTKDAPDLKVIDRIVVSYGGQDGEQATYTASQGRIPLKGRVVIILYNHKAYIIHYIAEEKSFDKYLKGMTNVLQSLKFSEPKSILETYTNDTYGYSIGHPKDWKVADKSDNTHREVIVVAPGNLANDLIASHKDDSLKDKASLEKAISARKAFLQSETGLTINKFDSKADEKQGQWEMNGRKTIDGKQWAVAEFGFVAANGRVLLEQAGYSLDDGKQYKDAVLQVLASFKTQ